MNNNNAHKSGYKHTPIGWIPHSWEICAVGDAFEICNNLRYPINEELRKSIKGEYPYYGPTKIQDYINEYRVEGKFALIGEDGDHFLKWKELPMTILAEGKFNVNNHAHLLKGSSKSITEWFYYYYQHKELTTYLTRQGAGRYKLTKDALSKMPVALPSIEEQQKIATILSTWDEAIKRTQRLIEQLKQRNKGLMQQLLTGKKRLKGFSGKWKLYSFDQLLKVVKRPVEWDDNRLYRLISVRRRSGGIFERESLFGHQIKVKDLRTTHAGDFLFSKMQIVHGASALVTNDFDGTQISGSYIAVVARDRKILAVEYFNLYSRLSFFYHQTYMSSYGVHIEKMTFDFESYLSLSIHLPDIDEQRAIVSIINSAINELKLYEQQLTNLQEQKKGMMQKLLSGEVRVKTS
jgi:type I restriction enzyme S subunit